MTQQPLPSYAEQPKYIISKQYLCLFFLIRNRQEKNLIFATTEFYDTRSISVEQTIEIYGNILSII
jgi:hypothetical protein